MANNLIVSTDIAVSGMKAQAERLRIISENMANADSIAGAPGEAPYRRQVVTFKNYVDKFISEFDILMLKSLSSEKGKLLTFVITGTDVGKVYMLLKETIK